MQWALPGWVDLAMLGVIAISALVGARRGFTLEVLSLAGWVVAWIGSGWLQPSLAPYLPIGAAGSALNRGAAFACAFLVLLLLWGLAARAVAALVAATPLRPLDRLLGAAFGLARGVFALLVLATVLAYTPAGHAAAWHESQGAIWLNAILRGIFPMAPWQPRDGPAPQTV